MDPFVIQYVDAKIGQVKAEMTAEIAKLDSTISSAEAQRTIDYKSITDTLKDVQGSLPTTSTIWKAAGATVLGVIAAAALGWAIFDTGTGLVGSFADDVLQARGANNELRDQNELLNNKLDLLLETQTREPLGQNVTQNEDTKRQ